MIAYNYNFGKLRPDGSIEYGPIPLIVITHHHEEWDEPIIDPETGEPTGETERKTRDWDTIETKIRPSVADYLQMGYLPVFDRLPSAPPREGWHYEPRGWEEADGAIRRVYAEVQDSPPPPRTFSKLKIVNALIASDIWQQVKAFLEQAGLYDQFLAAQDFAEDNQYFGQGKAALQNLLSWTDEQVEDMLAASVLD